ncbi:hypothetical protein POM88_023930 [Heracleum sosnowskyi]|uniref:Carboxypeptidase n=1 Tax=Heracleum sosnowskyi TaxID=360622 RepID=A0AAD8II73_9APIA|nr:hypothetical protein POM88_023930 [Heracleum sosnowskyi]
MAPEFIFLIAPNKPHRREPSSSFIVKVNVYGGVLDLMLGFTDEDKQKTGVAHQGAGKGVVRGVLGLPGRLVGGIMGESSAQGSGGHHLVPMPNHLWLIDLHSENILCNLPQAELRLLCSLLANKGLSDNAYALVAEVLKKLVAIVPVYCHLFISELAGMDRPSLMSQVCAVNTDLHCPGCSSIGGGAFTELGPFFPKGHGRGLGINSKSWNKASNLLFIESPAGVGWSYSNTTSDYNCGDASTARDMYIFLINWFAEFPSYKDRHLFLTGESYAGHYILQLAIALLDHNEQSRGYKFNIKGVAIGNRLLKLDCDAPAVYEYFWSHGMISDEIGLAIFNECDFEDYTLDGKHNVSATCNEAMNKPNDIVGEYVNNYDVILDVCYPSIVEQELRLRKIATKISVGVDVCMFYERSFYFNLPEVEKALHANMTNLKYKWSMCRGLLNYTYADGSIDILPLLKRIIQNHIPVWVFSGDEDSVVLLLGSRTLVRELAHDMQFKITVPYGAWFHKGQDPNKFVAAVARSATADSAYHRSFCDAFSEKVTTQTTNRSPYSSMASSILANSTKRGSTSMGSAARSLIRGNHQQLTTPLFGQGASSPSTFTSLLSRNHQQLLTLLPRKGASSFNSFTSLLSGQSTGSDFL